MSTSPLRKDEYLTDNVIDLTEKKRKKEVLPALITGGPTGPENWLGPLAKGTIFLARAKGDTSLNGIILNKYLILDHLTQSTNLLWATPDGKQLDIWVPTLEFSRKFQLQEVVGVIGMGEEEEQPQSETTDGNSSRSV